MGGFHRALAELGHECVFASELDEELRSLYLQNFPGMKGRVYGDIRQFKSKVPPHDVLCAGFPCQPFSKSGSQLGISDETRGTLFHEILDILSHRRPRYVLLENVGNFSRHDNGRTWAIVRRQLESLGYAVAGTEHVTPLPDKDWRDSGLSIDRQVQKVPSKLAPWMPGSGLLSPHHFGEPHHRERFFIVGSLDQLPLPPLPLRQSNKATSLKTIMQGDSELTPSDRRETMLTERQVECINLWNELLARLPEELPLPSFPIWGDEFLIKYPYYPLTPYSCPISDLRRQLGRAGTRETREELFSYLPRYARDEVETFRQWKLNYIEKNRAWWAVVARYAPRGWPSRLASLPPSLRKLEWNAKGETRNIWSHVLQFRPSGLRIKRFSSSPALIAMTATQIPILGPKRRFLSRVEGLRLQGFPDNHMLPSSRAGAFKALGNGVHVIVARAVGACLLGQSDDVFEVLPDAPKELNSTNIARGDNVYRIA